MRPRGALRAGHAWVQTFIQDIADQKTDATNAQVIKMHTGHFMAEEAPEQTAQHLFGFLK